MSKIAVLLSDFIRAESGDASAVFETRVQVAQSAVFHLLTSNNKTQWNMVTAACQMYADPKACAAALNEAGVNPATGKAWTTASAQVKKMHAVYAAYGAAIDSLELPSFVKGRPVAEIESIASDAALQVATLVTGALTVSPKEPLTDEAKAAKEKAKADKVAKAKAEQDALIAEQVAATVGGLSEVTLDDLVATIIRAVKTGMVDTGQLMDLYDAVTSVIDNDVEMAPLHVDPVLIDINTIGAPQLTA